VVRLRRLKVITMCAQRVVVEGTHQTLHT
jgi:hypothetical protein